MNYKTILRISDMLEAIEDWKRELIDDRKLLNELRDLYAALEKEIGPEAACAV
jgi:hypothetical protein